VPRRTNLRFVKRYIRTNALRRGLIGRERFWMAVFVLGLMGRQVNKVLKRGDAPIVFSERLKPGESFVITHLVPPPKRGKGA
jgi:hypothetical protein